MQWLQKLQWLRLCPHVHLTQCRLAQEIAMFADVQRRLTYRGENHQGGERGCRGRMPDL
jgi:hypothetical protein